MSDYRFGDDYKLSIYPKEAIDCWGEIDMNKVEAVEIEWVDFIRQPDDKSRWFELFGTPERAARMLAKACGECSAAFPCCECPLYPIVGSNMYEFEILEWLRGDA